MPRYRKVGSFRSCWTPQYFSWRKIHPKYCIRKLKFVNTGQTLLQNLWNLGKLKKKSYSMYLLVLFCYLIVLAKWIFFFFLQHCLSNIIVVMIKTELDKSVQNDSLLCLCWDHMYFSVNLCCIWKSIFLCHFSPVSLYPRPLCCNQSVMSVQDYLSTSKTCPLRLITL